MPLNLDKIPGGLDAQFMNMGLNINLKSLTADQIKAINHLIDVDQLEPFLNSLQQVGSFQEEFMSQINRLADVDQFYASLGGLKGYHRISMDLFRNRKISDEKRWVISTPPLIEKKSLTEEQIKQALLELKKTAFIFPVGGAGDRLNLVDPKTNEPLPAALLEFNGMSLIESLFIDIAALERLYLKIIGQSLTIPIVLMTSYAKNNTKHIQSLLERESYFGRLKEDVHFIIQPPVPVIDEEGNYLFEKGRVLTKPGGHGVIWKLLKEASFYQNLLNSGIQQFIVRQVNNPLASCSSTLLQLLFEGKGDFDFGFVGCSRRVGSPEGMLVLKKDPSTQKSLISNIEYTEFAKFGLEDLPETGSSQYSKYPGNLNLLFIKAKALGEAVDKEPIQGLLMNAKSTYVKEDRTLSYGRLESTMQSIADLFSDHGSGLRSFVLKMPRSECFTVTKKLSKTGQLELDTPESAFYDYQLFIRQTLAKVTGCFVPELPAYQNLLDTGYLNLFNFIHLLTPFNLNLPKLFNKCHFKKGSFLSVQIVDVNFTNCTFWGGLVIQAKDPSVQNCKVRFDRVIIKNEGLDQNLSLGDLSQKGAKGSSIKVILGENSEFVCERVALSGSIEWDVPNDTKVIVTEKAGRVSVKRIPLNKS